VKFIRIAAFEPSRQIKWLAAVAILALIVAGLAVSARRWKSPVALVIRQAAKAKEPDYSCREGEEINSIGMKLATIPAGEFLMGSPGKAEDVLSWAQQMSPGFPYQLEWFTGETPQHRVRITEPFAMGAFEVTKGQFAQFVASTSYVTDAEKSHGGTGWAGGNDFHRDPKFNWRNTGHEQTDSHPVVNVSWNDAVAFCQWLSTKEGRTYRLPTEAEWEYACRAGTTTRYNFGDDPEGLVAVGNVRDKTDQEQFSWIHCLAASDGYAFTAPVGQFQANGFGLYDMHGNVGEWCLDWYSEEYFPQSPPENPPGPSTGSLHVVRGGGWSRRAVGCRSTSRRANAATDCVDNIGFRVVCTP
jgi:formylglycine-generating enzyme